jgi:hypothetical protein
MPRHDKFSRLSAMRIPTDFLAQFNGRTWKPKRPPRPGGSLLPEPVEPPRPKPLSGGAAAELEFDE